MPIILAERMEIKESHKNHLKTRGHSDENKKMDQL